MNEEPLIGIKLNAAEVLELLRLLNRSLNTLDPTHWPSWAPELEFNLNKFIDKHGVKVNDVI